MKLNPHDPKTERDQVPCPRQLSLPQGGAVSGWVVSIFGQRGGESLFGFSEP